MMKDRVYYPLTHAQKRIWYTELVHPNTGFAHIPYLLWFEAADRGLLETTVNIIRARHDGLRLRLTRTGADDSEVSQYIEPYQESPVEVVDLTAGGKIACEDWVRERVSRPFPLHDSELSYFAILQSSGNQAALLMLLHHLVGDGWTANRLLGELATVYQQLRAGADASLLAAEIWPSYLEYIAREEEYLHSGDFSRDRQYWLDKFAQLPEVVSLGFPRRKSDSIRSEWELLGMESELREKIMLFCQQHKVSLYTLLVTAFVAYIGRVTGKQDITMGIPHHNRQTEREKMMSGMFVSTLALRFFLNDNQDFLALLQAVKAEIKASLVHGRYPFDQLMLQLREKQGFSGDLYHINLVQLPDVTSEGGPAKCHFVPLGENTGPLTVYIDNTICRWNHQELEFAFSYQTACFDKAAVVQIFNGLTTLLTDALATPTKKIWQLEIVTETDKKQLLVDFNQTTLSVPTDKSIHRLFAEQVARTPDKTALVFREKRYTYRELNARSNQLARLLRAKGVDRDRIVAIMVERSAEIVIGALAVLKAGGAYLPIDPEYPAERIAYMLEDSQATLLLTQRNLTEKIGDYPGEWLALEAERYQGNRDRDINAAADETTSNITAAIDEGLTDINHPEDLAYVIYTSGSTGKPKGVMIEHRSLVNLCCWRNQADPITPADNAAEYIGFAFDPAVMSIFTALLYGAALHILPEEIRLSPLQMDEYFTKHQITLTVLPAQFGEQFMELTDNRSLRRLVVGGERLKQYYPRQYQCVNEYGPTEYTVTATQFLIDRYYDNFPIGKPVSNTWLYVLNHYNQLQPPGMAGELCIAGAQLARGYWGRPELTAEKFVDNPFATGEINAKMYKTGDLVRWLPDGNMEFLGRIDQQVKIRGYRVELGEIEQQLVQHPDIREAVVLDRTDSQGTHLCAYLVSDRQDVSEEIQGFLAKSLPDYMIPAFFVPVDQIPLTTNGKVDKQVLRELTKNLSSQVIYEAPRNETEEKLAAIWQELLGVERVGIRDDFFRLGGHSLKVAALISQIKQTFQISLPFKSIFTDSVLADFAAVVRKAGRIVLPPILKSEVRETYPLLVPQKKILSYVRNHSGGNVSVPLELKGTLDVSRLWQALDTMLARHDSLRSYLDYQGGQGEPVQRIAAPAALPRIVRRLNPTAVEDACREFFRPFVLDQPPLFRAELWELAPDWHILIIDTHHLIFDGTSMGILIRELGALYEGKVLPPLAIQYQDYSQWQDQLLQSQGLGFMEEYWRRILTGIRSLLVLPADYPREAVHDETADSVLGEASPELSRQAAAFAARERATVHVVMMTMYSLLLSRYSGQEAIAFEEGIAGRIYPEIEPLIGMFVNVIPVRGQTSGEKTFRNFLREMNENIIDAYDYQEYPVADLAEELGLVRENDGHSLVFDTGFVFQNLDIPQLTTAEQLIVRTYPLPGSTMPKAKARRELLLVVWENQDRIAMQMVYRKNLFARKRIEQMMADLKALLAYALEHPTATLTEIQATVPANEFLVCETV
ncbi:MAG TPA: amino acid adenylation domain-containing protein [Patescibacteria group bacterium]|nr:amino acid adenylation domain-containing protein [Patescibacteria group bacterium]